MKSFDEWFGEASQNKLFWESPSKASKMGFNAGQQSKQAEVDELQRRIDDALIAIGSDDFVDVRVDYSHQIIGIRKILKGNTNEH